MKIRKFNPMPLKMGEAHQMLRQFRGENPGFSYFVADIPGDAKIEDSTIAIVFHEHGLDDCLQYKFELRYPQLRIVDEVTRLVVKERHYEQCHYCGEWVTEDPMEEKDLSTTCDACGDIFCPNCLTDAPSGAFCNACGSLSGAAEAGGVKPP